MKLEQTKLVGSHLAMIICNDYLYEFLYGLYVACMHVLHVCCCVLFSIMYLTTTGMMIESMAGKSASLHGLCHDASPFTFSENTPAVDYFGQLLVKGL